MKGLVHIVADYSPGDLAFAEMVSALLKHLPDNYNIWGTSVASFDTIALGFEVAQLGLQDEQLRPEKTLVYANCAPRGDRTEARRSNEGEGILYGVLDNGVPILVVNSGFSLSFVRDSLRELWSVRVERGGSQFRSRDIFPPLVGKIARGDLDFVDGKLNPRTVIPEPPHGVIGYIDSFGNMKTTFRQNDPEIASLHEGTTLRLTINGVSRPAKVATGNFNVHDAETAFGPGSSGRDNRYFEIFRRGESIWSAFKCPPVGSRISIERVE
ncbi:MAG: hypothetical protein U0136_13700 [Bdellovibrionota bacterium]